MNVKTFIAFVHGLGHDRGIARPGSVRGPTLDVCNRFFLVLTDTRGFLETYLLATYLVFALTIFAFLFGIGFGMWKDAQAKYGYFAEAMEFAAQAANVTGDVEEVRENEGRARQYFTAAMGEMCSYSLNAFRAVEPRDRVPGGTAQAPGYLAQVTVEVFADDVPLIGRQTVKVPMRYYAVVKSQEF